MDMAHFIFAALVGNGVGRRWRRGGLGARLDAGERLRGLQDPPEQPAHRRRRLGVLLATQHLPAHAHRKLELAGVAREGLHLLPRRLGRIAQRAPHYQSDVHIVRCRRGVVGGGCCESKIACHVLAQHARHQCVRVRLDSTRLDGSAHPRVRPRLRLAGILRGEALRKGAHVRLRHEICEWPKPTLLGKLGEAEGGAHEQLRRAANGNEPLAVEHLQRP